MLAGFHKYLEAQGGGAGSGGGGSGGGGSGGGRQPGPSSPEQLLHMLQSYVEVGPARHCSPRRRMLFILIHEGSNACR